MVEAITTTARVVVDYEELVEEYKNRVIETEELGREVDPDVIIDSVVEDYFADIVCDVRISFVVPAETVKSIQERLKEILF